MTDQTFTDGTGSSDALGAGPGGAAVANPSLVSPEEFVEGAAAPYDVYVVYGFYEDVVDLDGSTVNIERAYPTHRYVTEIAANERGNLVVSAGNAVTSQVVAALST